MNNRKSIVILIILIILSAAATVFTFAVFAYNYGGFFQNNAALLTIIFSVIVAALAILSIIYSLKDKEFAFRLVFITFLMLTAAFIVLHVYNVSGIKDKVSSIEELRDYVSTLGNFAVLFMIVMQILQVILLPIPGMVAVGACVALFGEFKGALISLVGILIGSFIGFIVGRFLGYRAAKWLVGEKSLNKGLESVKGKDKAILTFMFLFPFFPDDVLCFVAGLSSMSFKYFTVMIIITRIISVFTTAYSVGGQIIPYNTWWGILIWAVLIIGVGLIAYFVYKNGEKIEKAVGDWFKKRFKKKGNDEKQTEE